LFLLPGLQVIIINAVYLVKKKGHYDFISPGIAVITGVCVGVGIWVRGGRRHTFRRNSFWHVIAVLDELVQPEIKLLPEVLLSYIYNDNTCVGLLVIKTVEASELFLAQGVPDCQGSKIFNAFLHRVYLHWGLAVWIKWVVTVAINDTRFTDSRVP
jgi:hypothetical protein